MVDAETFDAADWRPAPLLPARDGREKSLVLVVAVLSFLACLTVFVGVAADRAAGGWGRELKASATVQVRPSHGETPAESAARAAEALAAVPGVREARGLDKAEAEKLVEPWLGEGALPDDLPLPRLVAVELDPAAPATSEALTQALASAGVDASLDDHSRWLKEVERAGVVARTVAILACALTAACCAAVIAFATRQGLAARREVVEVLHLTGAEDSFVASLFQRRFAGLAFRSGLYGALAAALLAAAARLLGGEEGITPALPFAWIDLAAVLPCPLLAALTAAVSARRTAMSILGAEV